MCVSALLLFIAVWLWMYSTNGHHFLTTLHCYTPLCQSTSSIASSFLYIPHLTRPSPLLPTKTHLPLSEAIVCALYVCCRRYRRCTDSISFNHEIYSSTSPVHRSSISFSCSNNNKHLTYGASLNVGYYHLRNHITDCH